MDNELWYLNSDGYKVFTEKFHLNRGFCCENNCKHCPYDYDNKTQI